MRALRPLFVVVFLFAGAAAGCGSPVDDRDSPGRRSDTTSTPDAGDDLSIHADIASLRDGLLAAGLTCELEYEGLEDPDRIVSICVIDDEEALLTIWKDPAMLDAFLGTGDAPATMAYGANWTVEVDSEPVAATVADALGGARLAG